jgi:hypothetical protein
VSIYDAMSEEEEVAFLRQILSNMETMKAASATSSVPQKAPPAEAVERLREKINDKGHWTGGTNSDGYPKVKIDGESELASHVLLKAEGRSLRPGQVVMHKDNDKLNLRPGNLRVGTQAGNLKQMRDEGRDRPRGVPQEPDVETTTMRKKADELDRKYVEGLRPDFLRAPGVTRYQLQAMGKRLGMDPLAAYQISGMDAAAKGLPITHAVHQQAMSMGIPYPHHLGSAGRQPLSQLGDDLLEGLEKAKPPAAPAAPVATPAPATPQPPRPRAGFTTPIQPSPAVAGLSAPRPPTPVPQVPRPKVVAPKVSLSKPLMAAAMKLAANAAARHIRAAMEAGDIDLANQIGGGMAKLEMKPRFIKGLGQGLEAQADLMAGKSELGAEGLHVRKIYKPDSPISQGEETGHLLAEKKRIVDTARGLSPEAKEMVPAFHGVRRHETGGVPGFSSDHEYVHGLRPATKDPVAAVLNAKDLERHVVEPLKARGIHIDDIPLPSQGGFLFPRADNYSNFPLSPSGSGKMIDFLPTTGDTLDLTAPPPKGKVHMQGGKVLTHHAIPADSPFKGDALRKAVYRGAGMPAAPAKPGPGRWLVPAGLAATGLASVALGRALRKEPEAEEVKAASALLREHLPEELAAEVLSVLMG